MADKIISPFDWRELAAENKKKEGAKYTYKKREDQSLEWRRGQSVSRSIEKKRLEQSTYGTLTGVTKKEIPLLPRQFHVYSKAGTANTKAKK